MALPDSDISVGHSFGLEFDGVTIKQIAEVSGLQIDQDVVELRQGPGTGRLLVRKLPGRPKAGEVTLTRGLGHGDSFETWIRASRFGKLPDARKGGAIIVYDYEGTPVKRYKLTNAWPKSLEIGALKAGDTSVLTEKLVVTCERLEVE